jgi:quercetin 2,3-dioxygenase
MPERKVTKIYEGIDTSDGAGVKLKRLISQENMKETDPFLMLDFFGSDDPDEYIAGFPWHPHRGIETVTYMLEGKVQHEDSLGNKGIIERGDIQWMTAGSGIIHQEMPQISEGLMKGFQLWVNLPAKHKMTVPRYQEYSSDLIPVIKTEKSKIKVIAGSFENIEGPVKGLYMQPLYLDIELDANSELSVPVDEKFNTFAYIIEGTGYFSDMEKVSKGKLLIFTDGDTVSIKTKTDGIRFILVAGKPLNEPIAWQGPIVMNTQEELNTAFRELREDTFIK